MADVTVTISKGMIADEVLKNGFGVINDYDLRQWLAKHEASETT